MAFWQSVLCHLNFPSFPLVNNIFSGKHHNKHLHIFILHREAGVSQCIVTTSVCGHWLAIGNKGSVEFWQQIRSAKIISFLKNGGRVKRHARGWCSAYGPIGLPVEDSADIFQWMQMSKKLVASTTIISTKFTNFCLRFLSTN